MAPGNVSASEQVFLPYKQYSLTSLFVNREVAIIQVGGCFDITLILLSDIKFGTCGGCFLLYIMDYAAVLAGYRL